MTEIEIFSRFATALGLGLVIGLQRERAHEGDEAAVALVVLAGLVTAFSL